MFKGFWLQRSLPITKSYSKSVNQNHNDLVVLNSPNSTFTWYTNSTLNGFAIIGGCLSVKDVHCAFSRCTWDPLGIRDRMRLKLAAAFLIGTGYQCIRQKLPWLVQVSNIKWLEKYPLATMVLLSTLVSTSLSAALVLTPAFAVSLHELVPRQVRQAWFQS